MYSNSTKKSKKSLIIKEDPASTGAGSSFSRTREGILYFAIFAIHTMKFLSDSNPMNNRRSELILLLHAFSITCFVLVSNFLPLSFGLKSLKSIIISEATAQGVDISARVHTAYLFVLAGVTGVVFLYSLFRYLFKKGWFNVLRHDELTLFSTAILCLCFLQVMEIETLQVLKVLCIVFVLRMLMVIPGNKKTRIPAVLNTKTVVGLCLTFGFFLLFGIFFVAGKSEWLRVNVPMAYILCVAFIYFCYSLGYRIKRTPEQVTRVLLPVAAIPVFVFFSLEFFFFQKQVSGRLMPFRAIFYGVWAFFYMICLLRNYFRRKEGLPLATMIRNFLGPALIFAFVLLSSYQVTLGPMSELFENANPANSVMNVFCFGRIPLLEFTSSHMLAEQWYGYLYSLVFGYTGSPDFLIYNFLNTLLLFLLVYAFLNRLFRRPWLSLFFVLLFPLIQETFHSSVFLAILPAFLTRSLLEKPATTGFLKLFLILLILLIWKLDTGAAALIVSVIYFPLLWIIARKPFPVLPFLKGLALFAALLFLALLIAGALLPSVQLWTNMQLALHYFTANQAHGYASILKNFTQQFYILHVLLPFVAVCSSLYILIILRGTYRSRSWQERLRLLFSLFLFLLFLANLQRALVRHGYAEYNEHILFSTFFPALGLLLVDLTATRRALSQVVLLYFSMFFAFLVFKFFPFHPERILLEEALTQHTFGRMEEVMYEQGAGRIKADTGFARKNYGALKQFLDKHLKPGQTFLDFSNTPMLYFYCKRQIPAYFNQSLQNSVDDYLQLDMIRRADTATVPVVVLANYPRQWFDATDEIPNQLRYYLVAEYIYAHYIPYGIIGNKSIWVSRTLAPLPPLSETDTLLTRPEQVNLGHLAEYTGNFYRKRTPAEYLRPAEYPVGKYLSSKGDTLIVPLTPQLLQSRACYMDIGFKSSGTFEPYRVTVEVRNKEGSIVGNITFIRSDKVSSRYFIRLSNHYFWHFNDYLELNIYPSAGLSEINFLNDIRLED